jgi:hypothetical protein
MGRMSIPQFTVKKVSEDTVTTLQGIIRVLNSLIDNLGNIFQTYTSKVQNDSVILTNIALKSGNNPINHTLGRVLTGWSIVDIVGKAKIDRYAPSTNTTLFLNSDIACTISLMVF